MRLPWQRNEGVAEVELPFILPNGIYFVHNQF